MRRSPLRPILLLAALASFVVLLGGSAGAQDESPGWAPLIIGGETAKPGDLPSLAFVLYLIPNGKHEAIQCSGTVVAPRLVLTAGHCVRPEGIRYDIDNFRVVTGNVDWTKPHRQVLHVTRVMRYPFADMFSGLGDAALLELSELTDAPTLHLAKRRFWGEDDDAEVAGWGKTYLAQHDATDVVHRGPVHVRGVDWCARREVPRKMVCVTGAPGLRTSPCFGDSGGPLLTHRPGDGELVEIGVLHGGFGCNPRTPHVYTSSSMIFNWVRARIVEVRAEPAPAPEPPAAGP